MSVYIPTGKLGSGKTLVAVGRIFDYVKQGRPVATNLDIYVEHIMKRDSKHTITRLPDKPRPQDLSNLGYGNESVEEENNGLIVLDECGTWLNSRSWSDKERKEFIDWMLHARKYGWDVVLIVQDISIIDKQVRLALCEHLVICKRLDRLQVPFISPITKLFGFKTRFPKIHRGIVHYGDSEQDIIADKWTYMARNLYPAYDTRQIFKYDILEHDGEEIDMRASYTLLSRWHLEGRYYVKPKLNIPTNFFQLLIYPTWLIILIIRRISNGAARSSAPLRSV